MSKLLAAEELMRLVLISLCLLKACVCLLFEMHSFWGSFWSSFLNSCLNSWRSLFKPFNCGVRPFNCCFSCLWVFYFVLSDESLEKLILSPLTDESGCCISCPMMLYSVVLWIVILLPPSSIKNPCLLNVN